jgi:hypothetical protein
MTPEANTDPEPTDNALPDETVETVAEAVAADPLVELLGSEVNVRILMALINETDPMNPTRICERAAISRNAWYDNKETLIDRYAVIEEAESAGNSPMYRVNRDNDPIINHLEQIYDEAAQRRRAVMG